ncbi:MAG: hypothetical protein EOM80_11875 [Erysipelotrichia bacterium]|nr:hypothetical protein [Erysipelotrichia bacterium]
MTSELLKNRYEFTRDGKAIIDISVESINDLFNSFDKKATFTKRELDQDFAEYVVDCVKEIGDNGFIVRIIVDREYNMLQENILRKAMVNFFSYLHDVELRNLRREFRKFSLLMLLGILLMFVVSTYKLPDTPEIEMWKKILQEGVIIAAWVAFWEAFTSLIFGWSPFYQKSGIYGKIVAAEVRVINNLGRIEL